MGLCLWVRLEVAVCLGWGVSLGSCLLMGGAVIPPGLLLGLGLLSADGLMGVNQIFPERPPPEKGMLPNTPKSSASSALPPQ